ncbi:hypothetical protein EsH8_XIV_000018 [Colletotrichum jinshuiense]
MPPHKHFRGVDLVHLVGHQRPRIRWAPADTVAVEAHLARHRLNLGTYDTLYFAELLDELLRRDGLSIGADPEVATLVRDKVKGTLLYRLRKLASEGHVELGRGMYGEHTARWEPYTRRWAEPGWDGYKQQQQQQQPPPPPPHGLHDSNDDGPPPPAVACVANRQCMAESLSLPPSPPASPRLCPRAGGSEPWRAECLGSQSTLEGNLAAFERPSPPPAPAGAGFPSQRVAAPASPPRFWQLLAREPATPPPSSAVSASKDPPAVEDNTAISPVSDRYLAMTRAAERASGSPRPPPPSGLRHQQQQQQQRQLHHERQYQQEQRSAVQVEQPPAPRRQQGWRAQQPRPPGTRPRVIAAVPFILFRDQALVYHKMLRCALVVLLLTNGLAGGGLDEKARGRLLGEVRERMRLLAPVNADIERRLAKSSLVFGVAGHGAMAIRNLYRTVGVEYSG